MSFLSAALQILADSKEPLSATELTDRALSRGLIVTVGRTPADSMTAALYVEATRSAPRVRKVAGPGRIRAKRGSVRWALSSLVDQAQAET